MRYTLKDYQDDGVAEVLSRLGRARDDVRKWNSPVAFSLTATTGAGKTVMAAAVLEALFDGDAEHDFQADPSAIVLWFTDDKALNQQTRFRLMQAADRLNSSSRLVVVDNSFQQEKLDPGKVYFLNRQKLGKNSLLVRGAAEPDPDDPNRPLENLPPPDDRAFTFWDTLQNTIEDPNRTLYLILDEAHRGMKSRTGKERKERATIVQRLINGHNGVPPVPIVWGISATVERFEDAMKSAQGRTVYPPVVVDPARVQESGLLKDDIRLEFPTESGQFDTVLLARAARKVREATALWRDYAEREGLAEPVVPLLVVQVPNKPSAELLISAFSTVKEAWPELEPDAMAHVFGDHQTLELGGYSVPHISPERVQDERYIRVLYAKDAVSTGWDCPRAEVLVSFRPARDQTHITQLLGRMVRTPLARRVPGQRHAECRGVPAAAFRSTDRHHGCRGIARLGGRRQRRYWRRRGPAGAVQSQGHAGQPGNPGTGLERLRSHAFANTAAQSRATGAQANRACPRIVARRASGQRAEGGVQETDCLPGWTCGAVSGAFG